MTDPTPDLFRQLAAIGDYLRAAQQLMAEGAIPDFTGLDHRMADLCRKAEQAQGPDRARALKELTVILAGLDACKASILKSAKAANPEGSPHG